MHFSFHFAKKIKKFHFLFFYGKNLTCRDREEKLMKKSLDKEEANFLNNALVIFLLTPLTFSTFPKVTDSKMNPLVEQI